MANITIEKSACEACGKVMAVKELKLGMCDGCAENYFECGNCSDVTNMDDSYAILGILYCQDCYDELTFTCNGCDNTLSRNDHEADGYCRDCYEPEEDDDDNDNETGAIFSAGYMPQRFILSKEPWENTLYQGIELEIECQEDANPVRHATNFKKWLLENGFARYIYLKEDGSLRNGYEIVSHPFTALARNKIMNWFKILNYLKRCKTQVKSSCGLHIHVSRDHMTTKDIGKLKMFFWSCKANIQEIAGRLENSYCIYQRFTLADYKAGNYQNAGRYHAVNVNQDRKKPTIEFRLFAATLDHETFIARLQFTEAVCEFVKRHRAQEHERSASAWALFCKYVAVERYSTLHRHMKKIGVA